MPLSTHPERMSRKDPTPSHEDGPMTWDGVGGPIAGNPSSDPDTDAYDDASDV